VGKPTVMCGQTRSRKCMGNSHTADSVISHTTVTV